MIKNKGNLKMETKEIEIGLSTFVPDIYFELEVLNEIDPDLTEMIWNDEDEECEWILDGLTEALTSFVNNSKLKFEIDLENKKVFLRNSLFSSETDSKETKVNCEH